MPTAVYVSAGKLTPCGSGVSEVARPTLSNSDRLYLVDTEASISVVPLNIMLPTLLAELKVRAPWALK